MKKSLYLCSALLVACQLQTPSGSPLQPSRSGSFPVDIMPQRVLLQGKVELPQVHPRNLFPRRRISTKHHLGHKVMNYSDAEMERIPHKMQNQSPLNAEQIKLSKVLQVWAVPIQPAESAFSTQQNSIPPCPELQAGQDKPPIPPGGCRLPNGQIARSEASAPPQSTGESAASPAETTAPQTPESSSTASSTDSLSEAELAVHSYGGQINDQGEFQIQVPEHPQGYWIYASGGRVHLKMRMREALKAGERSAPLRLDVRSSLLADVSRVSAEARQLDGEALKAKLPNLEQEVARYTSELQGRLRPRVWRARARQRAAEAGFKVQQPAFKLQQNSECATGDSAICYSADDEVIYNLMEASEITGLSSGHQHRLFTTSLSTSSRIAFRQMGPNLPRITAVSYEDEPTGSAYDPDEEEHSEESGILSFGSGMLSVSPSSTTVSGTHRENRWNGVDLVFNLGNTSENAAQNVYTVGLEIASRDDQRVPFRFRAYDTGGNELHEYRWYTTTNGHFYGITVPEDAGPIGRLRVEFRTLNENLSVEPFEIREIYTASEYIADDLNLADGGSISLQSALGWRSDGVWSLEGDDSDNSDFQHPYFGYSGRDARQQGSSSEGRYWHAAYGTSSDGDSLISPAFTLGNLDLDRDDFRNGFAGFLSGFADGGDMRAEEISFSTADGSVSGTMTARRAAFCRLIGGDDCVNTDWAEWFLPPPLGLGHSVAPMATHWGHVHWQAYIDVENDAETEEVSGSTERYVEYSTDNGATWRIAHWFDDENHRGKNGLWWKNHMHPFPDSDLRGQDFNNNGSVDTDFDKDGSADYRPPVDNNDDGSTDSNDTREWDTEWYMEWVDPARWSNIDDDSYLDSDIEGVSIIYRFRFVGPDTPTSDNPCHFDAETDNDELSCEGWKIDDVSFNNDDPEVGYYTHFNGFYDYNQP